MISIILTGYGGPGSLDDVETFMKSIARGRSFSLDQIDSAKKRYELIGGKSPINDITGKQATALEVEMQSSGLDCFVDFGMLHLKPYIADVIKKRLDQGIEMFVVVSLAPFHSRVSTGAYFQTARELFDRVVNNNIEVVYISNWRNNSYYIEAMAEGINKSLDAFFSSVKEEVNIIFSVHSLPLEFIEQGDPYVDEVELTIELLLPRLHSTNWYLAFQSKGRGENWLKPDVETVLQSISKKQVKDVLIVPLGFVSDHVETLYDIDILYQEFSRKIGINLKRCPALNDSALFIKALADEVRKNTEHWRRG